MAFTPAAPRQNENVTDPDLSDALDALRKDIFLTLNAHAVGTIDSFDAVTQTAVVTLNYLRTDIAQSSGGDYKAVTKKYPPLLDVPVVFLGGGNSALTLPVAKGDECIVLFNDRCIDGWFAGSSSSALPSSRLHSMSDGIALVGVRSLAKVLPGLDTSRVVLRNGQTGTSRVAAGGDHAAIEFGTGASMVSVKVEGSKVTVAKGSKTFILTDSSFKVDLGSSVSLELTAAGKLAINSAAGDFMTLLTTVLTDIQSATAGGYPLVSPNLAADLATLQSFKP